MPRYGGKTMTSSFPLDIQGRRHCEPIYSVGLKDQRERRRQCAKRHHGKGDQQKRHISEHSERVLTRGAGAPERPSVDTHTHQSCGPTHRTGRPGPLKPLLYSAAIPRGAAGGHGGQLGPVHRPPPGIPPPPQPAASTRTRAWPWPWRLYVSSHVRPARRRFCVSRFSAIPGPPSPLGLSAHVEPGRRRSLI